MTGSCLSPRSDEHRGSCLSPRSDEHRSSCLSPRSPAHHGSCDLHEGFRWAGGAALAVAAHIALGTFFLPPSELYDDAEQSGGFVVELAELPVMRPDVPLDVAPGPDQVQSVASPEIHAEKPTEKTEDVPAPDTADAPQPVLPAAHDPEVVLPAAAQEKKEQQQESQPQLAAPTTSATQAVAEEQGPVAKAPVQAAPKIVASNAVPKWQSRLQTLLERNKRYPATAQARRERGVVVVSFSMDRAGKLVESRVNRSSGYAALDAEALELLKRAQPFPLPPSELAGSLVNVEVPIRFNLQ